MIIDAFTFFNELDLLEIRLEMMSPHVDGFVIVESNKTQSSQDKPYNFLQNQDRFERFLSKIYYVKHQGSGEYSTVNSSWSQEQSQRNRLDEALANLWLDDEDVVLASDLDEIPNIRREIVSDLRTFENGIYTIPNKFFAYYANLQGFNADTGSEKHSDGTIMACYKQFREHGVGNLWSGKAHWPKLWAMSGWHLSWLGGPEKVREKALACIEPFDKSCVPSEEAMDDIFEERVIRQGFFNINHQDDNSVAMRVVDPKLPAFVRKKFPKLFYNE